MLYNDELHSFDKFISEWNLDTEYVLFGASKECIQFIRTIDLLLGENVLKIKYIVDHDVKNQTTLNTINEISSFYHQSKNIQTTRKNIQLIHIDDFQITPNTQVIITTDVYKQKYKQFLEKKGVKWTWYKNIASIWPYKHKNIVHIFQSDVLVTEKCSLNCSHCNMFMPHYEFPIHRELDTIISDIDSYFKIVDYVSVFHLVGGEPFLYPNIENVIKHILENYVTKIDKLIITTNGTILPKDTIIQLLKDNDVILSVSDYSDKLQFVKSKITKVLDVYKNNNIKCFI
jgi:hypothetical protein